MARNPKISPGLRSLAAGLLSTTAILTLGLPQEARAGTFVPGSYGYAYQQITGLRAFFSPMPPITFGSDTDSNATISPGGTLALSNIFDVPEAYVENNTETPNGGLGNNAGFFMGPPVGDFLGRTGGTSQKGQETPDYARGDAQIPTTNLSDIFTTGLNLANVAESYVNSAKQPTQQDPLFAFTQGNAVGRYVISSNNFTLSGPTGVSFLYNFRNELYAELGQNTPAGAPVGNQANARYEFSIVINEIMPGGQSEEVFRLEPLDNNFNVGLIEEGIANGGAFMGQINSLFVAHTCNSVDNSQGVCILNPTGDMPRTYQLQIRGEERVDTRIVRQIPEPFTILGATTAAGFGAFFKRQLNNKQQKRKT